MEVCTIFKTNFYYSCIFIIIRTSKKKKKKWIIDLFKKSNFTWGALRWTGVPFGLKAPTLLPGLPGIHKDKEVTED